MADKKRVHVIIMFSYDADPDDYGTDDNDRMAEIDYQNFTDFPMLLGDLITPLIEEGTISYSVTVTDA